MNYPLSSEPEPEPFDAAKTDGQTSQAVPDQR